VVVALLIQITTSGNTLKALLPIILIEDMQISSASANDLREQPEE
jgi:hypothetical protein